MLYNSISKLKILAKDKHIMKFKIKSYAKRIPEGSYTGVIREVYASSDSHYLWFTIDVDDSNKCLNISVPINSIVLNDFAVYFADKSSGEVDSDDFIDTMIEFTVYDKEINGEVYSKIKKITPVLDED